MNYQTWLDEQTVWINEQQKAYEKTCGRYILMVIVGAMVALFAIGWVSNRITKWFLWADIWAFDFSFLHTVFPIESSTKMLLKIAKKRNCERISRRIKPRPFCKKNA